MLPSLKFFLGCLSSAFKCFYVMLKNTSWTQAPARTVHRLLHWRSRKFCALPPTVLLTRSSIDEAGEMSLEIQCWAKEMRPRICPRKSVIKYDQNHNLLIDAILVEGLCVVVRLFSNFGPWCYHFLAGRPVVSYFASEHLSFFIYKMEIMVLTLPGRRFEGLRKIILVKCQVLNRWNIKIH